MCDTDHLEKERNDFLATVETTVEAHYLRYDTIKRASKLLDDPYEEMVNMEDRDKHINF